MVKASLDLNVQSFFSFVVCVGEKLALITSCSFSPFLPLLLLIVSQSFLSQRLVFHVFCSFYWQKFFANCVKICGAEVVSHQELSVSFKGAEGGKLKVFFCTNFLDLTSVTFPQFFTPDSKVLG